MSKVFGGVRGRVAIRTRRGEALNGEDYSLGQGIQVSIRTGRGEALNISGVDNGSYDKVSIRTGRGEALNLPLCTFLSMLRKK